MGWGTAYTDSAPLPPAAIDDDGYEEEPVATLREQPGLRPIACRDDGTRGTHPDQRACPSWCSIGQQEGDKYEHEIDSSNTMEAHHAMEDIPSVVASQYEPARPRRAEGYSATATLEPRLKQVGQGSPLIKVALCGEGVGRDEDERRIGFDYERLVLSLTDAGELAAVLQHLARQAEAP